MMEDNLSRVLDPVNFKPGANAMEAQFIKERLAKGETVAEISQSMLIAEATVQSFADLNKDQPTQAPVHEEKPSGRRK